MLSIPIINSMSDEKTRGDYLDLFYRAGADRVFLFVDNPFGDREKLAEAMTQLKENMAFYTHPTRQNCEGLTGLEVGVWIGGLGHGGPLAHDKAAKSGSYTKIRGLSNGGESGDSFCPLDPDYRAMYIDFVTEIAKTGAPMIMIDDDLRLAFHGPAVLGCACDRHMALFNKRAKAAGLADHDYTREELASFLFTGPAVPLRKVWLDLMGDTLRDFARDLRAAVDSVNPAIRLGHCACLSTWDMDGVDSVELARIFAGNTRPFLRLIGAAYWNANHNFRTTGMGSLTDLIRMQTAWCRELAPEMELMSEGDVYPRPRFNVPASFLESYHQALTAAGMPDILKYMIDYSHEPYYETGYIRLHERGQILRDQIADAYAGTEDAGVYVYEAMHKLADMDCTGISEHEIFTRFVPASVNFVSRLGLPAAFTRTKYTPTTLVFGENAKTVPAEALEGSLILDAVSAQILTDRGVDVGLVSAEPMAKPASETLGVQKYTYPVDTAGRFWRMNTAEGAYALSSYDNGAPALYAYKRPNGKPVLVYAFDMESVNFGSVYMKNYSRRRQILQHGELDIPVAVDEDPGLYVICRKNENKMAVGMWNFGMDIVLPQEKIRFDENYRTILPIGKGDVMGMGTAAAYLDEIPPYCFGGFVVKK